MMRKFWQLQWNDRLILFEAILMLALSVIVIAILPFRYAGRLSSLRIARREPLGDERALTVRRVRWAVLASARRVPWRAMCFEQGLAAQMMLRRRGIASVLYFGAAPNDQRGLAAHVWVRDGDIDVVGGESAAEFAVLAAFPPASSDRSAANYVHRAGTRL